MTLNVGVTFILFFLPYVIVTNWLKINQAICDVRQLPWQVDDHRLQYAVKN
jgi:uncharacterized membrane protein